MSDKTVMADWTSTPWAWWVSLAIVALAVITFIFQVGRWYGSVNSDRDAFKTFMSEVRDHMKSINNQIREIFVRLPPVVISKSSPIQLTELGRTVSEQLGAAEIADELAIQLKEKMINLSAYDVQEECLRYVNNLYNPPKETEDAIKDCAYQNGISRSNVLQVIAVELRDRILSERGNGE